MAARARILAIDDQLYFRNLLVGLLSEEGYDVVAAAPGAGAADALVERGPFDLVIMDVIGTGSSPGDAVAAVRTRAPDPAILVVTGADDVRSAVSALQEGASDYLLKPIDRGALLAAIHRALQRPASASGTSQLLDENIEFMGRLSLLERVLPLLCELEIEPLVKGLLELCCVEACGTQGSLWLRRDSEASFLPVASFGSGDPASATPWSAPNDVVSRSLGSGMALITHDAGSGQDKPSLFVPFFCGPLLVAIARVSARVEGEFREPDAQAALEVGELGGLALRNALEHERSRADRLHEPRTQLPGRAFYTQVIQTEVQRAHRFGRRLCCLCVDVETDPTETAVVEAVVQSLVATLRTTDVLCAESTGRYWVLITETDPLGGVVLKRRLAEGIRAAIGRAGQHTVRAALGVASYPLDGESHEALMACAEDRARIDRESVIHDLGFDGNEPLARIGERLLGRACSLPAGALGDVAEFLIGELTCRPHDSGLLFLAPGGDPAPIMAPLMAMGDAETATEVFLATDGDTVPACSALTAVALPPDFSHETAWMVRFGEGPPYALLAGPPEPDGSRRIYHTTDPVLVEHVTFRLCAEVGVGVRS